MFASLSAYLQLVTPVWITELKEEREKQHLDEPLLQHGAITIALKT